MSSLDHVEQFCDVCVLMKQRWLPFLQQSSFRAKEWLELMHGDLCGPMTPATPGGRRYFLLLVDDLSRYMWVVVLGSKEEAVNAIRHAQASAEAECGRKLRVLCTNNNGEFTMTEFVSYCVDEGVQYHYSTSYNLQQNDVIEQRNQTVVGMAHALLKQREIADCLLGSGDGDGCQHPQPLAHQGSQRQDVVRGLAWVKADSLSPTGLRLPHVHQGAWAHRQARR
jgi:transposase InsO family protein